MQGWGLNRWQRLVVIAGATVCLLRSIQLFNDGPDSRPGTAFLAAVGLAVLALSRPQAGEKYLPHVPSLWVKRLSLGFIVAVVGFIAYVGFMNFRASEAQPGTASIAYVRPYASQPATENLKQAVQAELDQIERQSKLDRARPLVTPTRAAEPLQKFPTVDASDDPGGDNE